MQLNSRPVLAFFATVFLMLAGALYGVNALDTSLERYRTDVKASNERQIAFDKIAVVFKVQVQEWKDTLLRGRNPPDLDKHWSAFLEREHEVTERIDALVTSLPEGESRDLLRRFAAEHENLGQQYRAGLNKFRLAGFEPRVGDTAVRGIDREPERLLELAGEKIAGDRNATVAEAAAQGKRAALISLSAILLASIVCMFVFLVI